MSTDLQHAQEGATLARWAARGGVAGPAIFAGVVILGATLSDGYSHLSQKISELGGQGAQFAALQNANFILLGVLVIGFAWALGRTLGPPYRGAALVAVFGISSCIANGLLPCDVACAGQTPVGLAHNVTGVLGFVSAIGGMRILARRWRDDPRWRDHATLTNWAAIAATLGLLWFIATQAMDAHALGGLAQRAFVTALLLWIARTAWLLDRHLAAGYQVPPLRPSGAG